MQHQSIQQGTINQQQHQQVMPQQQQMTQHQQQQLQQQPATSEQALPTLDAETSITSGIKAFKGFFQKDQQGPNLGFQPTAAMAQRHEEALVSGKRPLFQFQVTKLRSWRTGYVRLLSLYDDHFCTFDPDTHQVTNTWNYSTLQDFIAIEKDQFLLQVNADKLKFQCHNVDRSMVLTALLQCQEDHIVKEGELQRQQQAPITMCNRWTRHGTVVPSALKVTPYALVENHPVSKEALQTYRFVDIMAVSFTSDDSTGIILYLRTKKTRLFSITSKSRADIVTWMKQNYDRIGLELRMTDSSSIQQWREKKREQQRRSDSVVATEWKVTKNSKRHDSSVVGSSSGWPGGVISRTLCITSTGQVLEKDASGMIVSIRSLSELYALVRPANAGDTLILEYIDGQSRTYSSQSRDSLLVSLIDAATALGNNPQVHVSDVLSGGYCLASFANSVIPEKSGGLLQPISIPLHCLKRLHAVATAAFSYVNTNTESSTQDGAPVNPIEECRNVMEVCREFNASVLPTAEGLPNGEKDKQVLGSIGALWGLVADLLEVKKDDQYMAEQTAGPMFQSLHRLSKTNAGYKNSIELATFLDCLPLLWTIEDAFCKFWAFRALTALLSGLSTSMNESRDKEVEYVNKSVIFKTGGPHLIKGLVSSLLNKDASDLIRMVMSDILQSVLCSFADTTSPEHFGSFIQALGDGYQALLSTLYQQTPFVIENSALLLHLLSTHAPSVAAAIRESALSTAILLHHFHAAIFSPLEGQRFLSRFLCSLWLAGPMDCDEKKLFKRIVPSGFMGYLKMPTLSRTEEEQLDQLERDTVEVNTPEEKKSDESRAAAIIGTANPSGAAGTNTSRLRARIVLTRATSKYKEEQQQSPENFRIFFHVLTQNHALPDLIWNQQTRRELRIGLESEIQHIQRETEARGMHEIAWNHQQFGIEYPSLKNELRVGSVYMRLWLQAGEGFIKTWDEPLRLFELLFRRFLSEMDRNTNVTIMCIRCMERLYSVHGCTIGAFPDVMILIRSMVSTRSIETQHRLLGLLATILGVQKDENGDENRANIPENAEQLLNSESIKQLCHFVAWGHTNGVQVGNLMTRVLNSERTHSGLAMLTDGNPMRPEGEGGIDDAGNAVPDASCPALWFIASTGRVPPPAESIRGPYRVSELQKMMELGDLSPFTLVTPTHVESYDDDESLEATGVKEAHIDTGKWNRLDEVWQLRWQLCTDGSGTGIYSPSEVTIRAIRSLTRLVDLHKSLDSRGLPYYPIPTAKRVMCGLTREPSKSGGDSTLQRDSFLSILTQSILCNDPMVVDEAAELLFKLTEYNEEAISKFYLTGVYFFITCYTGSNFKTLAKVLHLTHLKQHFRSGFAAAADNSELSVKERSILGGMLPEGVLFMLLNYGVDRFNDVFVGNFDTPEVIWSFEMRKHLIEMVLQHLGDFPKRLWQNTTTSYEYCPMPGVAYKQLEKEIFCHNYYLRNLCDETRFPDWPIVEPVEVFRACLEEFKNQMNRDETEEGKALEIATTVLNLKAGDGSKELRKSYRMLARKYHPDKVSLIFSKHKINEPMYTQLSCFFRIQQEAKCLKLFRRHMSCSYHLLKKVKRFKQLLITMLLTRLLTQIRFQTLQRALSVGSNRWSQCSY
jgi:DnaJ family protein C protein 13